MSDDEAAALREKLREVMRDLETSEWVVKDLTRQRDEANESREITGRRCASIEKELVELTERAEKAEVRAAAAELALVTAGGARA